MRVVNGESVRRLAENCPPREVIKKHRLKKPIPTTKILQRKRERERGRSIKCKKSEITIVLGFKNH